ncbi:hypothetical protein EV379_0899 [Microterricola gilva]|uniref:Uncharacterized protein n=1 Tax=Microterricola gilva TaxID=393267 RepID=A0A4V2GAK5_9MICO|nr:hypothetical protein [Microterricola gilva]RZU64596.1 hypothetical protein EV379_0899 [Microterricola gilva]
MSKHRDTFTPISRHAQGRWRVERAGAPRGLGYARGWLATNILTGVGAYLTTWTEAMELATGGPLEPKSTRPTWAEIAEFSDSLVCVSEATA